MCHAETNGSPYYTLSRWIVSDWCRFLGNGRPENYFSRIGLPRRRRSLGSNAIEPWGSGDAEVFICTNQRSDRPAGRLNVWGDLTSARPTLEAEKPGSSLRYHRTYGQHLIVVWEYLVSYQHSHNEFLRAWYSKKAMRRLID